jgi:hypothetical protein
MGLETPQQVQQHNAARTVVNTFAGHTRSRQISQFGDDHYWITHAHAKCFHLRCIVNAEVNIQVGHGYTLTML